MAQSPGGRGARFLRNIGWNALGQVGVFAVNFFATPYLVARLGVEAYGVYILLHAAVGYLLLGSLGAGSATVKYVSEFAPAHDAASLSAARRYSLGFHGLGVAALGLAASAAAPWLCGAFFQLPPSQVDAGVFIVRCAAGGALFNALAQRELSTLQGLQRFDAYNALVLFQSLLVPLGAVALLAAGHGLRSVGAWYALASALSWLAAALAARAFLPGDGRGASKLSLERFSTYSLNLALGPLAWILTFQADKLFVARQLPLAELTRYGVPAGLLQRLQTVAALIGAVLFPMLGELTAKEDLARVYLKSVRALAWLLLPGLLLLFALMPQFLGLWLGPEFSGVSVWPARCLVLAQICLLSTQVPTLVAASRDAAHYLSLHAWAQALLSLTAWYFLIPRLGILGAGVGSLIAQALPAVVFLALAHRRFLGLSPGRFLEGVLAPAVSGALLLLVVFPLHAQATSWARLLGLVGAGLCAFYGSTYFLLADDERRLLRGFLRFER